MSLFLGTIWCKMLGPFFHSPWTFITKGQFANCSFMSVFYETNFLQKVVVVVLHVMSCHVCLKKDTRRSEVKWRQMWGANFQLLPIVVSYSSKKIKAFYYSTVHTPTPHSRCGFLQLILSKHRFIDRVLIVSNRVLIVFIDRVLIVSNRVLIVFIDRVLIVSNRVLIVS